jgi:hypothetical protein
MDARKPLNCPLLPRYAIQLQSKGPSPNDGPLRLLSRGFCELLVKRCDFCGKKKGKCCWSFDMERQTKPKSI